RMITPAFTITQTPAFVKICIKAPYIKVTLTDNVDRILKEILQSPRVEDQTANSTYKSYKFKFQDDERVKSSYDVSIGEIVIELPKETPGEEFPDLDLLTKLLAPRKSKILEKPLIEVVGESKGENDDHKGDEEEFAKELIENVDRVQDGMLKIIEEATDFDWEMPQKIHEKEDPLATVASYGFNGCYSGYFMHLQETCNEIIDISDPEKSTFESRRRDR
ncbi:7855_t:CDS:2, partial [Acaulospora morrowiae]